MTVERGEGKRPLVAQWGGIPLRREKHAVLDDQPPRVWNTRTELLERFLADTCELCGSTADVEVHHIRRLADLQAKGQGDKPAWVKTMAARQRKTLVVCHACHGDIHAGRPTRQAGAVLDTGEPDARKRGTSGSEGGRRKSADRSGR